MATKIIEDIFGLTWLNKKIQKAIKIRTWDEHPIPKGYHQLKEILQEKQNRESINIEAITTLTLSTEISKIRNIENYSICIPKEKLQGNEFQKYAYHISIAALAVDYGFSVELIPESKNIKTPDLKLTKNNISFYVECKKKDNYKKRKPAIQEEDLVRKMNSVIEKNNGGYRAVTIFLSESKLDKIEEEKLLTLIDQSIKKSDTGFFINDIGNCALFIEKLDKTSDDLIIKIPMRGNSLPSAATASAVFEPNENGASRWAKNINAELYTIDSHTTSSIENSNIRTARKQIPKDAYGVIYIDIDLSLVEEEDYFIYMNMLNHIIGKLLTKKDNSRIAAIVVSAEIKYGGKLFTFIKNKKCNILEGVSLPGEKRKQNLLYDSMRNSTQR